MKINEILSEVEKTDSLISDIQRDCKKFLIEIKKCKNFLYRGVSQNIKDFTIIKSRKEDRRPKNMPKVLHDYLNQQFIKKFGWPVRNGVFATFDDYVTGYYGESYIFFPIGDYKYAYSTSITDLFEDYYEDLRFLKDNKDLRFEYAYDHEKKYGSKTGKGKWVYKTKDKTLIARSKNFPDALKYFTKVLNKNDEEVMSNVIWFPDVSLDDYIKEIIKEKQKIIFNDMDEIVKTYKTRDLGKNKEVEISFYCDKYYLINTGFGDDLEEKFL